MKNAAIIEGSQSAKGMRFAVVVSKFNDFVTDRLQAGALAALAGRRCRRRATSPSCACPAPSRFRRPRGQAAKTGGYHAIVCLGCLIRGATPHFEYIASAVSHGLTEAAGATGVPMTFGVLTTNSVEEALERAGDGPSNKGWEAATAAVEMATILAELARRHAMARTSADRA